MCNIMSHTDYYQKALITGLVTVAIVYSIEPPNKGHFGNNMNSAVLFREAVLF